MAKLPNLVWLRSFEAAARHMSFTAAAAELGVTQTALSLHVRSLEAALGCKLFTRAARHLTLTDLGQAYAFSVRRALGDIGLSTASLFGPSSAQVLTVRVPISTAALWLAHRLPKFTAAHPDISLKLVSNIWASSADQDDVDVDVRLGHGEWAQLASRKISQERVVPIALSSAASRKLPVTELAHGPIVQILGYQDLWHQYLNSHDTVANNTPPYTVDTTIAAIDIVAAGGGCAMILERFAHTAIQTGKPISILGAPMAINQSHYLVGRETSGMNDTARQLFEAWLEAEFRAD
nr:LysR family transcriptional regulator [uncultured Shimia sp.]